MTGAVRTGAARTATAERAICAGANASTEEHKASISIPSDEAICASRKFRRRFCENVWLGGYHAPQGELAAGAGSGAAQRTTFTSL